MIKIFKFILTLFFLNLLFTSNTYAYLDPGSGSIILQAIVAAIAAGGVTIKIYWQKVKSLFKIRRIIEDHKLFFDGLKGLIKKVNL